MQKRKRVFAMFMALALVLTAMLPMAAVSAAEYTDPTTITIKAPASLSLVGGSFKVYQVFGLGNNIYADEINEVRYPYVLNTGFDGFWPAYKANFGSTEDTLRDYLSTISMTFSPSKNVTPFEDSAAMRTVSKSLMDYAATAPITPTAQNTSVQASDLNAAGELVFTVPQGYYLVVGTAKAADGGADVTTTCALVAAVIFTGGNPLVDLNGVVLNLKADAPEIEKEVWFHETDTWQSWTDVNMGTEVPFRITSHVPNMVGYSSYKFTVHDKMTKGLTMSTDKSKYVVKYDGTTLTEGVDYTITFDAADPAGESGFHIAFDSVKFKGYTAGKTIEITYTATLNEFALIGPALDGNINDAQLEYSNDPYTSSTGKTPWKRARVFTYTFRMQKNRVDSDGNKTPVGLAGAEFELRTVADDPSTALKMVSTGNSGSPWNANLYRLFTNKDADAGVTGVTRFVSPASGFIFFSGLDAGTYYLVEVKAPDGFMLSNGAKEVVIKRVPGTPFIGNYTVNDILADATGTCTVPVTNVAGIYLPETGGIGRIIFIVGGLALMGIASVGMIVRRKRFSGAIK